MYWSYKTIPELEGLEDNEKKRVFQQAQREANKKPGKWKGALVAGIGAGFGSLVFGYIGIIVGAFLGTLYAGKINMDNVEQVIKEWADSGKLETGSEVESS